MLVADVSEFGQGLQKDQRLLGIDYGEKSIGVALSDTRRKIATPYKTIHSKGNKRRDAQEVICLLEEMNAGGIIIGLPLNMNGTEGERCRETRAFVREILLLDDSPVLLWDERLSTKAVEGFMIEGDLTRKKRKKVIDKTAASFILQGVLDHLSLYHA